MENKLRKIIRLGWEGLKFAPKTWRGMLDETMIMNAVNNVEPELGYDFEILIRRASGQKNVRPKYAAKFNAGRGYAISILDERNTQIGEL